MKGPVNHDAREPDMPLVIAIERPVTTTAATWNCCKCNVEMFALDDQLRARLAQGHTFDATCRRCGQKMRVTASRILSPHSRTWRDGWGAVKHHTR